MQNLSSTNSMQLNNPLHKVCSVADVCLYNIVVKDLLLDTRKAISSANLYNTKDYLKEWRRRQLPSKSTSAQNIRAKTNKILQLQNKIRKNMYKEFFKSKNITAQCLNTLKEVQSEEDFWFKVDKKSEVMQAKSHSTLTLAESRLKLIKTRLRKNENTKSNVETFKDLTQAYADIVNRVAVKKSISSIDFSLKKNNEAKTVRPKSAPVKETLKEYPSNIATVSTLQIDFSNHNILMENKINSLNSLVNTRSKLMASKRIYNAENMFKPYFNYDETKPYDDQKFTPFSSLKYKNQRQKTEKKVNENTYNNEEKDLEPSVHNAFELPQIKKKRPSELNGVYYKMQGVSQVRKNRKSERSKNEASEIMKPGKKLLVKPKMKRIENLLSTPKSEEATEYSQSNERSQQNSRESTITYLGDVLPANREAHADENISFVDVNTPSTPDLRSKKQTEDFVMIGKHQETNNNKKNSKYKKFSLIQPESNVNNVQQNSKKQLNSKTTRGFGFSDVVNKSFKALIKGKSPQQEFQTQTEFFLKQRQVLTKKSSYFLEELDNIVTNHVDTATIKRVSLFDGLEKQSIHNDLNHHLFKGSNISSKGSEISMDADKRKEVTTSSSKKKLNDFNGKFKKRAGEESLDSLISEKEARVPQMNSEHSISRTLLAKNSRNNILKVNTSTHKVISSNKNLGRSEAAKTSESDGTNINYVKSSNESENDDHNSLCVDTRERDVVLIDRSVLSVVPSVNQNKRPSLHRQDAICIENEYDECEEPFKRVEKDIETEKTSLKSKVFSDEAAYRISHLYNEIHSQSDDLEFNENHDVFFENPELTKMLEDAEIWGFVPPEKERKMKSKKRVAKKPKKTKKTIKPKQPPYLLYEYLPKTSDFKNFEIVPPVFETKRSYDIDTSHMTAKVHRFQPENNEIGAHNLTTYSELAKNIKSFNEENQKLKSNQPCLNGRLAFSKNICRFDLPQIIYKLQEMSPMDYLKSHCHVVPRRKNLYLASFERQILRRTFDISRHVKTSKNMKTSRLGFSSGSAASSLGVLRNLEISAEDDDLLYNSKIRMKDLNKLLTFKETIEGIIDVHMEGISSQQLQHTLNLLHIGPNSLIDADVFCSLCALSERIFYSKYSSETTDVNGKKPYVESADFYNLVSQMYKLKIHPGINELFNML